MAQRGGWGVRVGVVRLAPVYLLLAGAVMTACGTSDAASPARPIVEGAYAIPSPGSVAAPGPPTALYPPGSWMAKLQPPMHGSAIAIGCLDSNGDGRLDRLDAVELQGLDIPLVRVGACPLLSLRREWFVADRDPPLRCDAAAPAPVLVVAIGGGGTQLLDRDQGVSVGLIDIVNALRTQANAGGVPLGVILMTSSIERADLPQTRMEEWLAADLRRRFEATSCLRVVLMGHSHGAVVITSAMSALEARYGPRMYGVLLDRSLLYYDREAMEFPKRAALLNVYQLNEGWHGDPIDAPNVTNFDASVEMAPRDPRDGPLPIVSVAHPTLDDASGVQFHVVEEVVKWLRGGDREHSP